MNNPWLKPHIVTQCGRWMILFISSQYRTFLDLHRRFWKGRNSRAPRLVMENTARIFSKAEQRSRYHKGRCCCFLRTQTFVVWSTQSKWHAEQRQGELKQKKTENSILTRTDSQLLKDVWWGGKTTNTTCDSFIYRSVFFLFAFIFSYTNIKFRFYIVT